MFFRFLICVMWLQWRLLCSCFCGDSDSGGPGRAYAPGGQVQKEAWSSIVCQVNLFPGSLFSFSSNPSLFLFYYQLPPSVERVNTQLPPSMERYAEHSRAGRTLPEGNAITFFMLSGLPIRGFLSKNANRPEIECISKCNRELKCIFRKCG